MNFVVIFSLVISSFCAFEVQAASVFGSEAGGGAASGSECSSGTNSGVSSSSSSPKKSRRRIHDPYAWGKKLVSNKAEYDRLLAMERHCSVTSERIKYLERVIEEKYYQNDVEYFEVLLLLAKIPNPLDIHYGGLALDLAYRVKKSSFIVDALLALTLKPSPQQKDRVLQIFEYFRDRRDEHGYFICGEKIDLQVFEFLVALLRVDWRTDEEKDRDSLDYLKIAYAGELLRYVRFFYPESKFSSIERRAHLALMYVVGFEGRKASAFYIRNNAQSWTQDWRRANWLICQEGWE